MKQFRDFKCDLPCQQAHIFGKYGKAANQGEFPDRPQRAGFAAFGLQARGSGQR